MSDNWKKDPQLPPTESRDDDDIIELVEEISEESPRHPLSALEQKLLDIDDNRNTAVPTFADLPDITDLGRIDFEEEEDEEKAPEESPPPAEAGPEPTGLSAVQDAAQLFGPDEKVDSAATEKDPAAPLDEIQEIAEFDEQFLDAEDLLESPPTPPEDIASVDEEDLELLEIEEDDGDDEIVWFDDLDKPDHDTSPAGQTPEEVKPEAPPLDTEAEPVQDTSAADVFAAHVESARADAYTATGLAATAAEAGSERAAASEAAAFQAPTEFPLSTPQTTAADASPPAAPGLASEEIEAAVERVIARKLGGAIEAIILQAIEKAVSKEIERLKSLLLEGEDSDRTP